eukprot:m.447754 g.447754  ORF g.447754 m.447754 type:complete len:133 (-) comp19558_c0_seq1:1076-1474(-)
MGVLRFIHLCTQELQPVHVQKTQCKRENGLSVAVAFRVDGVFSDFAAMLFYETADRHCPGEIPAIPFVAVLVACACLQHPDLGLPEICKCCNSLCVHTCDQRLLESKHTIDHTAGAFAEPRLGSDSIKPIYA